jgi:hypothetical protein
VEDPAGYGLTVVEIRRRNRPLSWLRQTGLSPGGVKAARKLEGLYQRVEASGFAAWRAEPSGVAP